MDASVRKLNAAQTTSFDIEYIDQTMFDNLTKQIDMLFPTKHPFHLLDVGGGNGLYADKVLMRYPDANVTLIEPEHSLLIKNTAHPQKHLVEALFQETQFDIAFDIIQFNWVLHHFVSDTYSATKSLQLDALTRAFQLLNHGGLVVIFENFYEGMLVQNLPSSLIYQSTSSKLLAPITSRMGANTAGIGVCFNSRGVWHDMLLEAGFNTVLHVPFYAFGTLGVFKSRLLHLKQQNVGLLIGKKN